MNAAKATSAYIAAALTWLAVPMVGLAGLSASATPWEGLHTGKVALTVAIVAAHALAGAVLLLYGAGAAGYSVTAPVVGLQVVATVSLSYLWSLRLLVGGFLAVAATVLAVAALVVSRPSGPD